MTRASSRSGTASSADQKPQIDLVTDAVARTAASGPYSGGKRLYGYVKSDLMWVGEKSTPDVQLRPYMSAQLKKVVTPEEVAEMGQGPPGPAGRRHRLLPADGAFPPLPLPAFRPRFHPVPFARVRWPRGGHRHWGAW